MSKHRRAAVFLTLALDACFSFTYPTEPDLCGSHVDVNMCASDAGGDAADIGADAQPMGSLPDSEASDR
jgi:hypothetical protein